MNSYNHYALGAVVGFHYSRLAGIAPRAPGFRRIAVRPLYIPDIGNSQALGATQAPRPGSGRH
ncbi:hypothetical protein [Stakelama flava]|uniref:hypothetical protein n=1 Tax=Stakelama flava TaxID=2860338 RepID=UPI001FEB2B31|nr:hypothetical protein [Stakelama flava]